MPLVTYDGDFTVAELAGPPVYEIPFPHDPKPYAYKLPYWQFLTSYTELPLGSPGPIGGTYVGGTPGSFKGIGGGVIEFWREYALVPDTRSEYESFVYTFQYPNRFGAQLLEITDTVPTRIQLDYFRTDNPESIALPRAPRAVQTTVGLLYMHFTSFINPGDEILAEDATLHCWKGNIYERQQRFVIYIGLPDALN